MTYTFHFTSPVVTFQGKQTATELAEGFCDNLLAISKGDSDFINSLIESWSVSRRSEIVRTAVRSNYQIFRESMKKALEKACAEKIISPPISINTLAVILIGIFDGLGLQMVIHPELMARQDLMKALNKAVLILLNTTP